MAVDLKSLFQSFKTKIGEKLNALNTRIDNLPQAGGISDDANQALTQGSDNLPFYEEMTDAEIKAAYERNANTNAFTDSLKTTVENFTGNLTSKADLDPATGKVVLSQIPRYSITEVISASEPTLAGFVANVNNYSFDIGDVIVIENTGVLTHYFYNGEDRSLETSYSEVNPATLSTVEWASVSGKPLPITNLSGTNTGDQDLSGLETIVNVDSKDAATLQAAKDYADANSATVTAQAITDALGHEVADAANLLTPVPLNAVFTDTVYTHPATHPPSIIAQDANNRFVTDAEKETWNNGTGGAAVVNRPIKYISASTPYTLVPTDFTDDKLVFTADAGETIQVVLDAGVTPANGELMLISGGNNFLVPTAGAGAGSPTYSIAITTPTEGQEFTEGDSIALTSTITETPAAGSVEFIFPENTNPTTTGLNAWIGGLVLSADKVSWNGNFESNLDDVAYTQAEKTKLAGIATGATANDTDANLKNRANHTGTQLASTISDFNTAVVNAGLKEHQINGTRITASITGTYAIDWNAGSQFILTPTGAVTLSDANLPVAPNTKVISGRFAASANTVEFPATWKAKASNDPLSATLDTHFTAETFPTYVLYTLENIPA